MTESTKCDENLEGCTSDPETCERDPEECMASVNADKTTEGKSMEECLGKSLETLSNAFMASARRWEMIVYPSLFAFILLAAYGFYLIYSLTNDVSRVANHMETIATNMNDMTVNMNAISHNMVLMTQTMDSQSSSMREMTLHMRHMSTSMGRMQYDMSIMNNSISRPMSFMNTFMPW